MRAPPAVSIDARPGTAWRVVQAVLPAAAAAVLVQWVGAWWLPGSSPALASMAAVTAALAGWWTSATPMSRLSWTGAEWWLDIQGAEPVVVGAPQVMMDLGSWMLLWVRPAAGGPRRWLALARADSGGLWHLMRAAVYSDAHDPEPSSAEERPPF